MPWPNPLKFLVDRAKALMPARPRGAGAAGENQAEAFLRDRGFVILARNWCNPADRREELDLVCRDGPTLVFVEVKARAPGALVPGYYAVNARKKRILRRAVRAYLARLPQRPATFRFDVVEIGSGGPGSGPRGAGPPLLHFENIPLFSKYFRG